ncbi:MAG: nucleoside triphosphate pyrophosphohydrolase [Clostridia bacterium]|nr:nucleoside triphosphate pyrophosphohydrolase [Clostridia bacterium]
MKTITIAPLSTPKTLTRAAWDAVLHAETLYLQTTEHPSAKPVKDAGLAFISMDDLYESAEDFDALNDAIAARLVSGGDCVYAVMGDGCFAQLPAIETAAKRKGFRVDVLPGVSYAKAAFPAVQDALAFTARTLPKRVDPSVPLCVQELDNPIIAGEVKLALSEIYPDEWPVTLATLQPDGHYAFRTFPLSELDRRRTLFAGSVLYVKPASFEERTRYGYYDLVAVMQRLRAPGGCPWDREQTHESLKADLIEECYELNDAIDEQDDAHIVEELGDVLMDVVFHSTIADEQGRFNETDVADGIVKKMIYRHPHVFGTEKAESSADVLKRWDELKQKEKNQKTQKEVLCAVPKRFPALMRSSKVQKRARKVGFDWNDAEEAMPKVYEELDELKAAMRGDGDVSEEAGDLLFAIVNVVRLLGLDGELLLHDATDKFITRFGKMEELAADDGKNLRDLPLSEQDKYWEKAKKSLFSE